MSTESYLPFNEQILVTIFFYSLINIHLNLYYSSKLAQSSVALYLDCSPKAYEFTNESELTS